MKIGECQKIIRLFEKNTWRNFWFKFYKHKISFSILQNVFWPFWSLKISKLKVDDTTFCYFFHWIVIYESLLLCDDRKTFNTLYYFEKILIFVQIGNVE